MRNKLLLFACILLCTAAAAQTGSHAVYVADPRINVHKLQGVTTMLIDSLNNMSPTDVTTGKFDQRFQPAKDPRQKIEPGKNYWFRFNVAGTAAFNNWWLMLVSADWFGDYTQHQQMDVYQVMNGQVVGMSKGGMFVPRAERPVKEVPAINRVYFNLLAGDTQQVYVRVYNQFGDMSLVPTIELRKSDTPVPISPSSTEFAVGTSVMMTLSILSLVFFFFVRDRSYLFFSGYTFFLALHYQVLNPAVPLIELLIPEHPHLISLLWTLFTMGGFILFLLFGRSFMNLHRLSKKTDTFWRWFIGVWVTVIVADMLVIYFLGSQFINESFFFVLFTVMLAFMVRFAFFKNILARFFVAGALWLTIFTILGGLWNNGLPLPFNPWFTGQMGQLLIYCFGLAYKIRLNEQAKAEADHIKDLDQIKSRFFANISHEFRTPLTLIRGPLQQIEDQSSNKKDDTTVNVPWNKIKVMRRHTDRLLELVNQLLDLSRLDSGKMKLQVAKGDVVQVLKTLAASFESMAERKQIHYHLHFTEQSRIGFFDHDKLEKIVTNLLGNALKYTPEKGSVSVIAETDEKRLRLSVEDSGPGIAKKELDKVFDRFYQSEGNESKGTGIGLALVKELTDLYRGQISVSSEPGKGSRFRVSLPIDITSFKEDELYYRAEEHEPRVSVHDNGTEDAHSPDTKHANTNLPLLLIVEDNTDLRNLMVEIVQNEYNVIEAVNGKEGYDKAIQEIPDLVISDVMMPLMDGFMLAEKLKKDERTSHIPIILLTAKAGQAHKIEGLETGADDYLTKPFDHQELLTRLRNLINQRKLLRQKFAGEIILKPSEVSVKSAEENFLQKVMQAIEANMSEEEFGVEELAREVAMSRSQLHRKLMALTGQSPSDVLRNTRLLRAKELLQKKAATPSEVAFRVGFNSHTYFSKCFKSAFGISPSEV